MAKLAINGGDRVRNKSFLFPAQETTSTEEAFEAAKIVEYGILSSFRGNSTESFYGGEKIRMLEKLFCTAFKSKKATAVNSCTSALQIACGAIGLKKDDEVIVTPWSMSCSATAPMIWGATPVFADIEPDYFCLDIKSIEEKITRKTKAIIAVDLFGQPFDPNIITLAEKHNLIIIEDAAQAIGSYFEPSLSDSKRYAGTLGDIGCFSFTQGKHLTAGEGGMITIAESKNEWYDRRCKLLRNHAEAVISSLPESDFIGHPEMEIGGHGDVMNMDMVGYNLRMTEVQAVILLRQMRRLDYFISTRQHNADRINNNIKTIPGITPAKIRPSCSHSYYVLAFLYDKDKMKGIHRDVFIEAVKAELCFEEKRLDKGVPIGCGYIKPLYMMPLFRRAIHPALEGYRYSTGDCPTAERLWKDDLFIIMYHNLPLTTLDIHDIGNAFHKVYENLDELIDHRTMVQNEGKRR